MSINKFKYVRVRRIIPDVILPELPGSSEFFLENNVLIYRSDALLLKKAPFVIFV